MFCPLDEMQPVGGWITQNHQRAPKQKPGHFIKSVLLLIRSDLKKQDWETSDVIISSINEHDIHWYIV